MQIILNRKGFDSSNGAQPSPIIPDVTLLFLPIPLGSGIKYSFPTFLYDSYFDIIR